MRVWSGLWLVVVLFVAGLLPASVQAGPPIDPTQMSGIPRADPQVPAGTLTVRVLEGSFDKPALEQEVSLKVTNADGSKTETLTTKTANQGRATFDGLDAYAGGQAVASTKFGDEEVRSQPIEIRADVGSRVMLVAGAAPAAADVPLPGSAFELDRTAVGTLMVGTFDLDERKPIPGVEVTLHIEPPEGEATTRQATSDAEGRVNFEGLAAPELPAGTKLYVEGALESDGPAKRSETFEMSTKSGMAVVLAKGRVPPARPAAPPQTRRLPPPRNVPSLPQGTVRVKVVDGQDQPVPDQEVLVIKKIAAGNDINIPGRTDATGVALVEADVDSEAFYMVGVTYDGGPYSSGFFQLDKRGGMAVDVRVYETTSDARMVRSALQYEVQPSENDMARVFRVWEVMVTGDKAFWVPDGLRLEAQSGAKGLKVLRPAEPWLDHEEKADWVTLARPIPPGELVNLSIGYLVEHDGVVAVDFATPFEVMQTSVLLPHDLTLHATGARPAENPHPNPEVVSYELGERPLGTPVSFSVSGLPIRNPMYRYLAIGFGLAMAAAVAFAIARHGRASAREQLVAQRDRLLKLLRESDPRSARRQRVVAALDRIYRQLDVLQSTEPPAKKG